MKIIGRPLVRRRARVPTIPEEEPVKPCKKALLVGIVYTRAAESEDGMDNATELQGPYRDVAEMKNLLITKYGYKDPDIVTLLDDPNLSTDFHPTRKNILQRIGDLVAKAKPGDRFFFLYAGHGTQVPNRNNSEEDGMDECIVPCDSHSDSGYILDNELQERLVKPLPPGSQLTAIFDTCHSESLLDLPHFRCNRVYVPWVNKGRRRSHTLWNALSRRQAMFITSRRIHQRRRLSDSVMMAKELKINQVLESSKSVDSDGTKTDRSSKRNRFLRLRPYQSAHLTTTTKARSRNLSIDTKSIPASRSSRGSSAVHSPGNILSPWHRCESPEPEFPCDGYCRDTPEFSGVSEKFKDSADVVSISSCKDSQEAIEGINGETMTQIMVEFLGEDPHPTWRKLMTSLSHSMYEKMAERHKKAHAYHLQKKIFKAKMLRRGIEPPELDDTPDTNNFIEPQLASPRPMDMDARWMP